MAQPRAYTQTTTFNDFTVTNPSDPHPGSTIDTELAEIKQNTDDLNTNIALIQRDDGKLKNESVHKDAFDQDALALIGLSGYTVKGDWTKLKSTVAITTWASDGASPAKSIVTKAGHGLADNTVVRLTTSATLPTGFTSSSDYYVVSSTSDTFKLASSSGGTPIAFTDAGSGTHSYSLPNTYVVGDLVTNNDATYVAHTAHTSSSGFVSTPWTLIANAAIETTGASVNAYTGDGVTSEFATTYNYSSVTDIQVFNAGALVATTLYTVGTNIITFTSPPIAGSSVVIWGDAVISQVAIGTTLSYRDTAGNHKTTAERWANHTGSVVTDAESGQPSSKYSAKEYAQGSLAAAGGSAMNWAQLATTPSATAADASAREWAIGVSTHKGDASAKEYATSAQYDSVEGASEYSAKHYSAQAQDWAVKATIVRNDANDADVDYSAKKYATDAATSFDNFDDRFLGGHTTAEREVGSGNIGKDHDGDALVAGAMYFDTTLAVMKVWTGSLWKQVIPTTADQTNIDTLVTGKDGTASTSGTTLNMALINTTVANLADVNNFATRYRTGASDPTTSKDDGDLFWNTTTDEMKVYDATSSSWVVPYLDSYSVDTVANNSAVAMSIALG
jgi:hypothetical protein